MKKEAAIAIPLLLLLSLNFVLAVASSNSVDFYVVDPTPINETSNSLLNFHFISAIIIIICLIIVAIYIIMRACKKKPETKKASKSSKRKR